MATVVAPERTLTPIDHIRLTRILAAHPQGWTSAPLRELLAASDLVASPSIAGDIVTMYSQFMVVDEATGARTKLALCYPADADPAAGFISVLAPLGAALLGLRVGDVAHWAVPDGESHATRIVEMLFQPEASGDYLT